MMDTQTIVDLITRHHEDMHACFQDGQSDILKKIDKCDDINAHYARELSAATGKTPEVCEMLTRMCNNYVPIVRDDDLKTALVRCFLGYPALWETLLEAARIKNTHDVYDASFDETLRSIRNTCVT